MNRFTILIIPAALLVGEAGAGDWSVGMSLGWAKGDTGVEDINRELSAGGLDARADSNDDSRGMWQLYLGYHFSPSWGMEAGYVDLGQVETRFSGTTTDIDSFLSSSANIHPNTAQGWRISGVYRHELVLLPQFRAVARAGAFAWNSEYTLQGVSTSLSLDEDGIDLSYGLGLELGLEGINDMPPGLATHLEWNRYDIDEEPIDTFSLGLTYRFD